MPLGPQGTHTYRHRMARVSQEHQASLRTQVGKGFRSTRRHFNVDLTNERSFWTLWQYSSRGIQPASIVIQYACWTGVVGARWSSEARKGYVPWFKVRKIGAHLVSAAFFLTLQHGIVHFLRSLMTNTNIPQMCYQKKRGDAVTTHDAVGHQVTAWRSSGSSSIRSVHTTARYAASPVGVGLSSSPVTAFCNVLLTPSAPTTRSA